MRSPEENDLASRRGAAAVAKAALLQAHRAAAMKERAVADAAAAAKADAREKALDDRVSRVVADEATRKAERDRRYAERKAKKQ